MRRLTAFRLAAVFIALLALSLLGAAARMRTMGDSWADDSNRAIERYAFADRSLTRDMLSARIGLLRNYDMINQDLATADQSLALLAHLADGDVPLQTSLARLRSRTRMAESFAEEFKSENALLQNSLARVAVLCNLLQDSPAAGTLSARFLRLTLDTSPPSVAAAKQALAAAAPARNDLTAQLVTHGRLLIELLPRVDQILNRVREGGLDGDIEAVRRLIVQHQRRVGKQHQRAFLGLLGAGGLAGFAWIVLVIYLEAQARERRRRRENERLSATVAGLLLEVSSEQLEQRIEHALQRLAAHAGATDAYLVLEEEPSGQGYGWSRDDPVPPDWPRRVVRMAQTLPAWEGDVLHLDPACDAHSPLTGMLEERGVTSLLLIRAAAPMAAVLGFERYDARGCRPDVVAGLRMAQAAILQALRRDRLERARLQLELRLARARRLEAIGAVASGVAHNFNNIIGAIAGFSEIAEIHAGRNAVVHRDLAEIRQAVHRARELVDEILDFGRGHDAERKPLALPALVAETVRLVRAAGRGTVALAIEDGPFEPCIEGNAAQLQQVFMNICNNAFHAMPVDPHVEVSVARRREAKPCAFSHGRLDPGDYAVVTIADRGCGIALAMQSRIFEPFFTGRQGGTGLGLSTAWEIVQEHGGTIHVSSTPGSGSSFHIWLPLLQEKAQATVAATPPVLQRGEGDLVLVAAPASARDAAEELVALLGYEPLRLDPDRADVADHAAQLEVDAILFVDAPDAARRLLPPDRHHEVPRNALFARRGGRLALVPTPLAHPIDVAGLAAALHRIHAAHALQP